MVIETKTNNLIDRIDIPSYQEKVNEINDMIVNKTGAGNDFLGWVDWPVDYDHEELDRIVEEADYVRANYDVLVVCGIGGSYLGARAAIEAINGTLPNGKMEIIWLGQTFDPTYIAQRLEYLKGRRFAINVISKSGTTTETSVAFRLLREMLEKRDGVEAARKAIIATTDKARGALFALAEKEGYVRFTIPDDIGGRYSVQTAVGLFPIACAGIDPHEILLGSADARRDLEDPNLDRNQAYKYAVIRRAMYATYHKAVEMFVTYVPGLVQIGEWWKQLFGESEGKGKKGLLPDSATFTTDLHSLGQFIQDGTPVLFETVLHLSHHRHDVKVPHDEANLDGLNYLEGRSLGNIQDRAFEGTLAAHTEDGKISNVVLELEEMNAHNLGYLFYFFERACAMSAYLNGVNPFNQPGVEIYKRNMFRLLGKPGF
ncbi:MAG: glucose-6-phosphate isomerase [Bacilli bacterium]|jgi:glucose-6-phosphate isomerase|nr:glucose-6-phosphate isomerase [Bacilli bacterium]